MAAQESKVSGIVKALAALEDEIDSLNLRVPEMQKAIQTQVQSEMEGLRDKTIQMARKEAESIIQDARTRAQVDADRTSEEAESRISEIQSRIDANFDDAVKAAVSTILKAD